MDTMLTDGSWLPAVTRRLSCCYVHWFNNHRLLEVNGDLPPVELEAAYYRHTTGLAETG